MPLKKHFKNNLDEEIILIPFHPQWGKSYQAEAARLQEKLGNRIVAIEHIGSTAILGIYAKPIIDIMVGVKSLEEAIPIIEKLKELGYEYCGEANVPGRLYFRSRSKNKQSFNLALCQYQSKIWTNSLLFRDYLNKHSDVAKYYELLKKKIFATGAKTLLKYSEFKHVFIEAAIKEARSEL